MMSTDDTQDLVDRKVRFRKWTFSFREVVLIVLLLVGVLLFLVFAGLFASRSSEQNTVSSQLTSKLTAVSTAQCNTSACLETAAYSVSFMNRSIDPCDNFFQFACGGYDILRTVDPGREIIVNMPKEMRKKNEAMLQNLLISGSLPHTLNSSSAERKLKEFYTSCMDDFTTEQLRGTPFINKVRPNLLSYLIDPNFNLSSWSLDGTLVQVHVELWLDAFYTTRVKTDPADSSREVIAIYPRGTGRFMRWSDYSDRPTPRQYKLQDDYKKFIRTVAQLITRDAGVSSDQSLSTRIDVFVTDAYEVESKIAKSASRSRHQRDAFNEAQKRTLSDLKQETGNTIDWTTQLSHLFNEVNITDNTKVVLPYPTYMGKLRELIEGLDPTTRNRKLHNYLTWRVLETYVQDLSWEYKHANRQFYVDKYGYANFLGTKRYCFMLAKRHFNVALSALFVNTHFDKKNKEKVTEITESVKMSLEKMIIANTWMDNATKDYAISKMKNSTYKIGYPDYMTDEAEVDAVYRELSISQSDLFGNLVACNLLRRRNLNKDLKQGEDRSQWFFNIYDNYVAIHWGWDQILVTAGILQFPMYGHAMPHYYSFGAIGSLLGHFVHHIIDEQGRRWDMGGVYNGTETGWWSNQTLHNYNEARRCVADVYNNVTQGPYTFFNGEQKTVDVNGDQFAWEAIAITTGIRVAYNAYQSWQQKYGQDPVFPGLQYSPSQLFFIAHAQKYCYNRDPTYDYLYARWLNANEETRVNVALMELPEFQQAFQCQASDNMVRTQRCTYY